MDLGLKGKTAFVSGSTAGIGYAIAQVLAAEGANVIINGRTKKRVDDAVSSIKSAVPNATVSGLEGDLSNEKGAKALLKNLPDLDILVNNMGIFEVAPFEKITDDDWERFFQTNVMSGVRLSRHCLPLMLKKNSGRIIFISSESAVNIPVEMIHYGMTKTAQLAISRGLAELTAGTNVTVNSVLPGPTYSEGVREFIKDMGAEQASGEMSHEDFVTDARPSSLLKRFAEPEEVANMVVFLCSDRASATNGAAVRTDGGIIRSIV